MQFAAAVDLLDLAFLGRASAGETDNALDHLAIELGPQVENSDSGEIQVREDFFGRFGRVLVHLDQGEQGVRINRPTV